MAVRNKGCVILNVAQVDNFFLFLPQSPGKYKALADCKRRGSEDLLVKNGDEIQLLHEDGEGQW